MLRLFVTCGAAFAGLAVVLGAFGAHALRDKLPQNLFNAFGTGVEYQMYHALALILLGVLYQLQPDNRLILWAGAMFIAGILLFSGSLYLLALTQIKWFGPITPIGGLSFILGWLLLLAASVKAG